MRLHRNRCVGGECTLDVLHFEYRAAQRSRTICGNSTLQVPINYLRESIRRHVCEEKTVNIQCSAVRRHHFWLLNWTFRRATFTSNSNHLCGTTCEPLQCVNLFIIEWCCWLLQLRAQAGRYKLQCRICLRFIAAFFSVARIQITLHIKHSISGKNEWTFGNIFASISLQFRLNGVCKGLCTQMHCGVQQTQITQVSNTRNDSKL